MASHQITIRVPPATKKAFGEYAQRFGLRDSELLKLLIVREKGRRGLEEAAKIIRAATPERRPAGAGGRLPTITAHLSSVIEVKEFDAYAARCGLNRNASGLWIVETELREKWLERAMMQD
jgi:hypothetical protein